MAGGSTAQTRVSVPASSTRLRAEPGEGGRRVQAARRHSWRDPLLVATAAGYAAATNIQPALFLASGTTRYATATAEDPQNTTSTSFVNIPNLSTTITIGTGKTADLMIDFSGELNGCSAIFVRAVVDGATTSPSSAQVFWPLAGLGAASHGFTFVKKAVKSGTHTVAIQWQELSNCAQAFISSRSMVVTANIH